MSKNFYKDRRIKKLNRDISKIESYYYRFVDAYKNDLDAQIYALQLKKNLLIRSLILETHLAIEDFLDSLIKIQLFKSNRRIKKKRAKDYRKYFYQLFVEAESFFSGNSSIGFKRKIILLRMMNIINKRLYNDLDLLNSLRNKCGHYWTLDSVIRRGIKRDKPKKLVLSYQGKNLFNSDVMIAFLKKYNDVFLKIAEKF